MAKKPQFPNVQKSKPRERVFAVMREGGGLPTKLHQTFNRAAYEAARLANKHPGSSFHVMQSVRVAAAEPVEQSA